MSRSIFSIFCILLLAHIAGCGGGGADSNPDAGIIFSDAEVVVDTSVPGDDLGDSSDLGVPPDSDSGGEDAGTDLPDAQVEPDLGLPDPDLGVPPGPVCGDGVVEGNEVCDDGNTVSETECPAGTQSCNRCNSVCSEWIVNLEGPVVSDFNLVFPDNEAVYYVWLPDSWSDFASAEDLCASRGGHAAFVDNSTAVLSELRSALSVTSGATRLYQPSKDCWIPVEDPTFPTTLAGCWGLYAVGNPLRQQCEFYVSGQEYPVCDFRFVHGAYTPYLYGFTTGLLRSYDVSNRFLDATVIPAANVSIDSLGPNTSVGTICLLPESGDRGTSVDSFPTYSRVCSNYFSSRNGSSCP